MKLPSRKILISLGVLLALLLVVLLALPFLVDVDRYRGLIETRAEEALGRDVGLGELGLSLLPFGVRVKSLSIGALPGEGGGELLTARSVRVGARLMPLLSKRLEVTSITVEAPQVNLVRGPDGSWNVQHLVPAREGAESDGGAGGTAGASSETEFIVRSLRLTDGRVVVRDAGPGRETPFEATLEDIDLELRELALDRPVDFSLTARLEVGQDRSALAADGKVGPLDSPAGIPVELTASLDRIPLAPLGLLLGDAIDFVAASGDASVSVAISGSAPDELDASGSLEIRRARVAFTAPGGSREDVPLELDISYDLGLRGAGEALRIDALQLDLSGNRLALQGSVQREEAGPRLDLAILPSSLLADDLAKLMALIGLEPPVSFASSSPIELEGRIRGVLSEASLPDVQATARLQDFTLSHASMSQPIEQVGAQVSFAGERLEVRGLRGVVGSSDLEGSVTLEGFSAPRVTFDLHSRQADFGELFSFLDTAQAASDPDAGTPGTVADGSDPLADLRLEGDLRIERGKFQTLDFSDLDATLSYAEGLMRLDPVRMRLYDGTFAGSIAAKVADEQPTFQIRGDAGRVDLDAFLSDNLEVTDLLLGRFSGRVETRGAGADYESIVRSLDGNGSMQVDEGKLGRLNVLGALSSASGVFGENTLKSLSGRLATEGTAFDEMTGDIRLTGGAMHLDNLRFAASDFRLIGDGVVDLLTTNLNGTFRLSFSPDLSAAMRAEDSKAAKLFYNSRTRQVELPFTLSGPFDAPRPGIDFEGIVKDRAQEEIRGYLQERLGLRDDDDAAPSSTTAQGEAGAPEDKPAASTRTHPSLVIEFDRPRWRGSFLARDLQIEGKVVGKNIARATLTLTDGDGREIETHATLRDVETFLGSVADRAASSTIPWTVKVKGEKLLGASFPVNVNVVLYNSAGESAESNLSVDR